MTAGVESVDAVAWAEAQLTADAQWVAACPGLVHLGFAPQGTVAPVCALWMQSSSEYLTAFGVRVWTDALVMVKHSGPQDNFPAIRTAAQRAYAILNRQKGAAQGSTIISCVLQQGFPLPEPALVNGVQWVSYVQLYRMLVV